ncbi:MAG: ABC transporter substrate-binding protein [Phycisphaerae bacterium]|nr:ABC transporter substrate-binding protein [Phycisphaerae bacterium]
MGGDMLDGSAKTGRVLRGVQVIAAMAATVFVGWLFVAYSAPSRQTYPEREKVVFWHMWTSNWADVINQIVDRYNRSQDRYEVVPLIITGGGAVQGGAVGADLKTMIAAAGGDPPDCMGQWEMVIPAWAERGVLTPLDTLMKPGEWEDLKKRLYPAVLNIGLYKGHFYGLSTGMNTWAMYYRPSHFIKAGLDPNRFPTTLEELDEVADKLYTYDDEGNISRIGFAPEWLNQWIAVFGGSLYDYGKSELTITNPRNVDALQYIVSYSNRYTFDALLKFKSGLPSTFAASWPFISGAFSICVDGQWRIEQLRQYAPELDYKTAPIPPPKGGKKLACWSNGNFMIVPTEAKNKAGAMDFIRFWSGMDDPVRAAEFYTWGGWLPIVPEIARAPVYQAYLKKYPEFRTFVEVMASPNVQVTPPTPVQAFLNQRLGWVEDAACRGVLTPQAALEQLDRDVRRELKNMRLPGRSVSGDSRAEK